MPAIPVGGFTGFTGVGYCCDRQEQKQHATAQLE